jgi:hypothetical protein
MYGLSHRDVRRAQVATTRWMLAEKFGWSLEYIDSLSLGDFAEWLQVEEGKARAFPRPKPKGRR